MKVVFPPLALGKAVSVFEVHMWVGERYSNLNHIRWAMWFCFPLIV